MLISAAVMHLGGVVSRYKCNVILHITSQK